MSNGLDVALMKDPFGKWSPELGDRHTDIEFGVYEWGSFFFNTLQAAETEYIDGEPIEEYEKRRSTAFRDSLTDFPLLARIDKFFRDANFSAAEIPMLQDELKRVESLPLDPNAAAFLEGMLAGCALALSEDMGITLLSS